MRKLYVVKNIVTQKYYSGRHYGDSCRTKNIQNAETFDEYWVKKCRTKPSEFPLGKNERFVEIEIKEKQ